MDRNNMDFYGILEGFETSIRTTINSRYLETVNEMNDGFNKLLERALANANTFDTSIKSAIRDVKVQLTSTLRVKDESRDDSQTQERELEINELPLENLDEEISTISGNQYSFMPSFRERSEAVYEHGDDNASGLDLNQPRSKTHNDSTHNSLLRDQESFEIQEEDKTNSRFSMSEQMRDEDIKSPKKRKFDENKNVSHPKIEQGNFSIPRIPSSERFSMGTFPAENQNLDENRGNDQINRSESEKIFNAYVHDSKRGIFHENNDRNSSNTDYPSYHPNKDGNNVFYQGSRSDINPFSSSRQAMLPNKVEHENTPQRSSLNYKTMSGYNRVKQDLGTSSSNNKIITHSQPQPNGLVVKSYECELCGLKSNFKNNVDLHIKRKHDLIKPFPCPHCEYGAERNDYLITHIMKKH